MKRPRRGILLGIAFLIAALGAFGASKQPDTLERFLGEQPESVGSDPRPAPLPAPLSEYQVPGVGSPEVSEFLAGAAGVLATFGFLTLLASLAARRRARTDSQDSRAS